MVRSGLKNNTSCFQSGSSCLEKAARLETAGAIRAATVVESLRAVPTHATTALEGGQEAEYNVLTSPSLNS